MALPMPRVGLVLDLSHTGFAAVLSADGEKVLASEVRKGGTRHDDLGEWLESLLAMASTPALVEESSKTSWNDVAWICVGLGPGSFTGIRIAMAFAQGIALPGKIPLYGFTSFEALFLSASPGGSAVAAVAANGGRHYIARSLDDAGILTAEWDQDECTVLVPGDHWDYGSIARHARAYDQGRGRDAHRPYYLQLSAAEDKAVADRAAARAARAEVTPEVH